MGLDGVELIMAVEEEFDLLISDAEAATMETPREMIGYVCRSVGATEIKVGNVPTHCQSQRAFYRVRRAIVEATGVERALVRPDTLLFTLFSENGQRDQWRGVRNDLRLGFFYSPNPRFLRRTAPATVKDLVDRFSSRNRAFVERRGIWTKAEVRDSISDDDDFVRDLGVG